MKKRIIYSVLFGVPGFFVSGIIALMACGLALAVLWLFVFGDNPWPALVENGFPIFFALVFFPAWLTSIAIGFYVGKRLESNPVFNRIHLLISIGATFISMVFIVIQWIYG